MKKTALFVLVCALFTSALFASWVSTSEGYYDATIRYLGKNCGQRTYDLDINFPITRENLVSSNAKLSKGQWEVVQKMLASYETRKGDTFEILFEAESSRIVYNFLCEFTSNTQYVYWCFTVSFYGR